MTLCMRDDSPVSTAKEWNYYSLEQWMMSGSLDAIAVETAREVLSSALQRQDAGIAADSLPHVEQLVATDDAVMCTLLPV